MINWEKYTIKKYKVILKFMAAIHLKKRWDGNMFTTVQQLLSL